MYRITKTSLELIHSEMRRSRRGQTGWELLEFLLTQFGLHFGGSGPAWQSLHSLLSHLIPRHVSVVISRFSLDLHDKMQNSLLAKAKSK